MRDRRAKEYHDGAIPFKTSGRPAEVLQPGDRRILSDSNGQLYETVDEKHALRYRGVGRRQLERDVSRGDVIATGPRNRLRYDVSSLIRLHERTKLCNPALTERAYRVGRIAAVLRGEDSDIWSTSTEGEKVLRQLWLAMEQRVPLVPLLRDLHREMEPDRRALRAEKLAKMLASRPDVYARIHQKLAQI